MQKVKLILISLFFCVYFADPNVGILEFYEAGDYILSGQDYGYSDNIIVEIWGAGSGGSVTYSYDCYYTPPPWLEEYCFNMTEFIGGTAGSYIKANIATNMGTINITVGKGGATCDYIPICEGGIGGTTFINVGDSYLAAGVGNDIVTNITNGYLIATCAGTEGKYGRIPPQYGGISVNTFNGKNNNIGQGSTCPSNYMQKGIDGGAVIYFNSLITPSSTTSPTSSNSLAPSKSSFISKSKSNSPTVSLSPSISVLIYSQTSSERSINLITLIVVIFTLTIVTFLLCSSLLICNCRYLCKNDNHY